MYPRCAQIFTCSLKYNLNQLFCFYFRTCKTFRWPCQTPEFISIQLKNTYITTHNPTLFVQLKVERLEQWNPGPSFKTYQSQRAKFAARKSRTNTAVYNFSRFQLTIRQNRGIRCIGQLEIVESAAYSGFRGSDSGIRTSTSGIRTSTSGIRGSDCGFSRLMQASNKMFVL